MKNTALTLLISISLGLLISCNPFNKVKQKPVLRVNDSEVTIQEFAERLSHKLKDYDALYAKEQSHLKRAKEQCIQEFILELLTKQYALEHQISVTSQSLEDESHKIRSQYPDDNAFRRSLSQENISYDQWMNQLNYSILQRLVHAQITKDIKPASDEKIKEYYNANRDHFQRAARIKLRQILVEKEEVAKRLYKELESGKPMSKLAKEFSLAPEASQDGVTDWIEKGSLEVFDQAFKLSPGQRSKIIKSPYGFHIYEVIKKEPELHLSLQEARVSIERHIRENQEQEIFSKWLDQEIRRSQIFRNEEMIQAIKVSTKSN